MRLRGYSPESDLEYRADDVSQCNASAAAQRIEKWFTSRFPKTPRPAVSKSGDDTMVGIEYSNNIRALHHKIRSDLHVVLRQIHLEQERNKRVSPMVGKEEEYQR